MPYDVYTGTHIEYIEQKEAKNGTIKDKLNPTGPTTIASGSPYFEGLECHTFVDHIHPNYSRTTPTGARTIVAISIVPAIIRGTTTAEKTTPTSHW